MRFTFLRERRYKSIHNVNIVIIVLAEILVLAACHLLSSVELKTIMF